MTSSLVSEMPTIQTQSPAKRITDEQAALVISGGGAKGAFAVGVLYDLHTRFRETGWFSIVGGASTGALIAPLAALMAANPDIADEALDVLIECYTMHDTSDFLDRRSWFKVLRKRDCINESRPLRELMESRFLPEWFDWLKCPDSPDCYVVYTNLRTGQRVTVSLKDEAVTRERFLTAVLASASVPVLMEATYVDDDPCYDGCLRDLLPFERAVDLGATTIVPVFLDPEVLEERDEGLNRFDRILARAFSILVDEVGKNDLEVPRLQANGVRIREELEEMYETLAHMMPTTAVRKLKNQICDMLRRTELQPLLGDRLRVRRIVGGIRPRYQLADEALTFQPDRMRSWFAHGQEVSRAVFDSSPFSFS